MSLAACAAQVANTTCEAADDIAAAQIDQGSYGSQVPPAMAMSASFLF